MAIGRPSRYEIDPGGDKPGDAGRLFFKTLTGANPAKGVRDMPIAVFSDSGPRRLGKVVGDGLIDLSVAAPGLPDNIIAFLKAGSRAGGL